MSATSTSSGSRRAAARPTSLIACFEQSRERVAAELALEVDALVSMAASSPYERQDRIRRELPLRCDPLSISERSDRVRKSMQLFDLHSQGRIVLSGYIPPG